MLEVTVESDGHRLDCFDNSFGLIGWYYNLVGCEEFQLIAKRQQVVSS